MSYLIKITLTSVFIWCVLMGIAVWWDGRDSIYVYALLLAILAMMITASLLFSLRGELFRGFASFMLVVFVTLVVATFVFRTHGISCNGEDVKDFPTIAYFSIVTFTTLGYGDCSPLPSNRFFAAALALFGMYAAGLFIAIVVNIATAVDRHD